MGGDYIDGYTLRHARPSPQKREADGKHSNILETAEQGWRKSLLRVYVQAGGATGAHTQGGNRARNGTAAVLPTGGRKEDAAVARRRRREGGEVGGIVSRSRRALVDLGKEAKAEIEAAGGHRGKRAAVKGRGAGRSGESQNEQGGGAVRSS